MFRGLLFDKSEGANWSVPWHQDLTISVSERRDVDGFRGWSRMKGVPHVQAPDGLLERMVAVRLHIDDCPAESGPLRVIPGSHRRGRLAPPDVRDALACQEPVECIVPRGGVVAFRSLLLHGSGEASAPTRRRVIHLEYVAREWRTLPGGLQWYEA